MPFSTKEVDTVRKSGQHAMVLLLLMIGLVFVSCQEADQRTGSLAIDFSNQESKSIMPSNTRISVIKITGTSSAQTLEEQYFLTGSAITIKGLSVGVWELTVTGYNGTSTDAPGTLMTSPAVQNVTIVSGKTTSAVFVLHYLTKTDANAKTGSAAITITWPDANSTIVSVKGELVAASTTRSTQTDTSVGSGSASLSFSGIHAEDYNLDLTMTNASGTTISFPFIDMVNIFSGLASDGSIPLVSADVPIVATPSFSITDDTSATRTVTMTSTSGARIYYTTDGSSPLVISGTNPGGTTKLYNISKKVVLTSPSTVVKAFAIMNGYQDSSVYTQQYEISNADSGTKIYDPFNLVDNTVSITKSSTVFTASYSVSGGSTGGCTCIAAWYLDGVLQSSDDTSDNTFTQPSGLGSGRHQLIVKLTVKDKGDARGKKVADAVFSSHSYGFTIQ